MSDFSKKPEELQRQPVDGIQGDVCDGCYYFCAKTEVCQYPGNALDHCTEQVNGDNDHWQNFVFVEVA